MIGDSLTILHVEDDDALAWIVRTAFQDFGFVGDVIKAETVKTAMELLCELRLSSGRWLRI